MAKPGPNYQELAKKMMANFKRGIYNVESNGSGTYRAQNTTTNALGKYQFVPSFHWPKIVAFAKKNGYGDLGPNNQSGWNKFLDNDALQEDFFEREWVPNHILPDAYKTYEQYGKKYGFSIEEVAALTHFRGAGGARTMLKDNTLNSKMESNNATGMGYINKYREAVPKDIQVRQPVQLTKGEIDNAYFNYNRKRREILNSDSSDEVKSLQIEQLNKKTWQDGTLDAVNEKIQEHNRISKKASEKALLDVNDLGSLLNMVNGGEGALGAFFDFGWGDPNKPQDFGKNEDVYLDSLSEQERNLIKENIEKYPQIGEFKGSRIVRFNKAKLLETVQIEYNKFKAPHDKIQLVTADSNRKLIKGKDFKTSEGMIEGITNTLTGKKSSNTLLIPTSLHSNNSADKIYNESKIPEIKLNQDWLTEAEAENLNSEDADSTEGATPNTDPDGNVVLDPNAPSENYTEAQKQIIEQQAKPNSDLSDSYFGLDLEYEAQTPLDGDVEYKTGDIPFAEIGSSLYGIIAGSNAADEELPMRDERVSDALIQYTNELRKISEQGLSPEEEAYAKNNLRDSYAIGLDTIVRASGGNRGAVLGNASRLDAQMIKGQSQIALMDMQKKQEALFKYGEAVKYINDVDLNKQIANNERLYQNAVATKEAGAALMQGGIQSMLDNIQYYKENAPGSANFALKSFYNKEVFGYDPNIKDDRSGNTPYTLSWLQKKDSENIAKVTKHNESKNMYASLDPETKIKINEFGQKVNWNSDMMNSIVAEVYKRNGQFDHFDYSQLTEAQKTGDISRIISDASMASDETPMGNLNEIAGPVVTEANEQNQLSQPVESISMAPSGIEAPKMDVNTVSSIIQDNILSPQNTQNVSMAPAKIEVPKLQESNIFTDESIQKIIDESQKVRQNSAKELLSTGNRTGVIPMSQIEEMKKIAGIL